MAFGLAVVLVAAGGWFTARSRIQNWIYWSHFKSVLGSSSPSYTIIDVGPGEPQEINTRGDVVGSVDFRPSRIPGYKGIGCYGYVWRGGQRMEIGTFGGPISTAFHVNEEGQVLGYADTSQLDPTRSLPGLQLYKGHPFLWNGGKMIDFSHLAGYKIISLDNFAPDGRLLITAIPTGVAERHAYLYDGKTMADLGKLPKHETSIHAINRQNQVIGDFTVGYHHNRNGTFPDDHAFLWQHGKFQDLGTLGGAESEAEAINDKGQVVGQSWLKGGSFHAFLWEHGKMQDVGTLAETADEGSAYSSDAKSINNSGQIVGYSELSNGMFPFLWENGHMLNLNKMVPQDSGWFNIGYAAAINEQGQIVGEGGEIGDDHDHSYLLTPIK